MTKFILTALIASAFVAWSAPGVAADRLTATGTRVQQDTYGSHRSWGRPLSLARDGKIVRVMDGTYGFQILDPNGRIVGDFLFPEDAIGFELAAGEYEVLPAVCRIHRHHHVEVTVEY